MNFPTDLNGDVFRRMLSAGFDFSRQHDFEFLAVFRTEDEAERVGQLYLEDHKAGDRLVNIETRPAQAGGMELLLVKRMTPTYEAVTAFESRLQARVDTADGYLDGWGVLQPEVKATE